MITGFNTDIEFGGVTYHVQTEDKGLSRPIILSLVYDRGTILASKRASYEDLLAGDFNEKVLSERLHKQHRLICAAIQAGRIEDLKKMTARESAGAKKPAAVAAKSPLVAYDDFNLVGSGAANPVADIPVDTDEMPIPKPVFEPGFGLPEKEPEAAMVEGISVIEEEIMLPDDAVMIIEEPAPKKPENDKLAIEIIGAVNFRGGERNTVNFIVSRGSARTGVSGAQIMIKILGSSFRPVIFHASTDFNGVATVNLQLPNFTSGRAAFLARAMSDGEETELRRSIAHG